MVAYSFRRQFVGQIARKEKRQTIRLRGGKRPPKIGEPFSLYQGLRTKSCRLIDTVVCRAVVPLMVDVPCQSVTASPQGPVPVPVEGNDLIQLARDDGFNSVAEFFQFFRKQYGEKQLDCWLIAWR